MRYGPFSIQDRTTIVTRWNAGESAALIARDLDLTPKQVYGVLKNARILGISVRRVAPHFSRKVKDAALSAYRAGHRTERILANFGLNINTLLHWASDAGIRHPRAETVVGRWCSKVRLPDAADGCWNWTGGTANGGYGTFRIGQGRGRLIGAHRFGYETFIGPIPAGLEIDHLCRNRLCVNPSHLEPVTHSENVRRGDAAAMYRNRTHCPKGHPYDAENTYRRATGGRECRRCHLDSTHRRRRHLRENRNASALNRRSTAA